MREIFNLFGTITVNGLDGVKTNLKKVDEQFAAVDKSLSKLGRQTTQLGTALSKNVTAPILAVAAGLGVAINNTVEYARHLEKLEAITGLSSTTLQEFQHIAKMTNTNFDGLVGTISKFTNKMAGIVLEGGKPYEALQKLGISARDSSGHIRDMNVLFPETIKALQNINNPTERNAFAMQIFGRSVSELAPVLALSNTQFDAMRKEAHDLGAVMGDEGLKANIAFGDEIKRLQTKFGAMVRDLATSFIPVLRDNLLPIIQGLADKIRGAATWFVNLDNGTKALLFTIVGGIAAIGPALLVAGKMTLLIKGLAATFALAKAQALGFNLVMAVNPFVAAIIGATLFLALLNGIIAAEEKRKTNEQRTKELEADAKFLKEMTDKLNTAKLLGLKDEQKRIQATIRSFNQGHGYAPGAAAPAAARSQTAFNFGGGEEQKENINDEYIQKLMEQGKTELQLLEVRKREALQKAKEQGVETIEIETWYEKERLRLIDEHQEKYLEAKDKQTEADKKDADDKKKRDDETGLQLFQRLLGQQGKETQLLNSQRQEELNKVRGNKQQEAMINEYYDKMIFEKKKSLAVQGLQFIGDAISKLGQLFQMNANNQLAEVENYQTAQEDAINKSTLSETQKKKKLDALHADTAKKEHDIKVKAAKEQKAIALMGAIVGTAVAVVNALQTQPVWLGIVMAAIVGVLGIAEIALIASQPIPAAKGAFVPKRAGGVTMQVGEGQEDEAVFPIRTGAKALAAAFLDEIGTMVMPKPSYAFAGAGGAGAGRPVENHWHIGTLIADDRGIKELERRQSQFRISEAQRKGANS